MLANNAQTIKTQRDQYTSQIPTLQSQVSTIQGNLTNMTKDRDNWRNIANSKKGMITQALSTSWFILNINLKPWQSYVVEILNGSSVAGCFVIRKRFSDYDLHLIPVIYNSFFQQDYEGVGQVNNPMSIQLGPNHDYVCQMWTRIESDTGTAMTLQFRKTSNYNSYIRYIPQ